MIPAMSGRTALTAGDLLKAAEDRIVVEGTALHNHVFSEVGGVGDLDNLKQGIFDDGVSQSGRDIRNGSAFLLRLFYVGVHEIQYSGYRGRSDFWQRAPPLRNPVRCNLRILRNVSMKEPQPDEQASLSCTLSTVPSLILMHFIS